MLAGRRVLMINFGRWRIAVVLAAASAGSVAGAQAPFSLAGKRVASAPASLVAQAPHGRAARAETVWSGEAGGYRWRWTTGDLTASRGGRTAFSALAFEKRTNQQLKDEA